MSDPASRTGDDPSAFPPMPRGWSPRDSRERAAERWIVHCEALAQHNRQLLPTLPLVENGQKTQQNQASTHVYYGASDNDLNQGVVGDDCDNGENAEAATLRTDLPTGYARLPAVLYRAKAMSNTSMRLVAYIAQMARGRRYAELYVEQIADALGVTGRTIQRVLIKAEKAGYITVQRVRTGRINSASRYWLSDDVSNPYTIPARRRVRRSHGGDIPVTPREKKKSKRISSLKQTDRNRASRPAPPPAPARQSGGGDAVPVAATRHPGQGAPRPLPPTTDRAAHPPDARQGTGYSTLENTS